MEVNKDGPAIEVVQKVVVSIRHLTSSRFVQHCRPVHSTKIDLRVFPTNNSPSQDPKQYMERCQHHRTSGSYLTVLYKMRLSTALQSTTLRGERATSVISQLTTALTKLPSSPTLGFSKIHSRSRSQSRDFCR